MLKPEGERSERDFASAMGATATQKRSLRNARPRAAAGSCHIKASKLGKERGKIRERLSHTALIVYNDLRRSGKRSKL